MNDKQRSGRGLWLAETRTALAQAPSKSDRNPAISKGRDWAGVAFLDHDPEIAEPRPQRGKVRRLVRSFIGRAELALQDRAQRHGIAHRSLDEQVSRVVRGLVAHRTDVLITGKPG